MNEPEPDAPNPPPAAVLERLAAREEFVRYLRIDFQRCLIQRGTRVKRLETEDPPIKAR